MSSQPIWEELVNEWDFVRWARLSFGVRDPDVPKCNGAGAGVRMHLDVLRGELREFMHAIGPKRNNGADQVLLYQQVCRPVVRRCFEATLHSTERLRQ